MSKFIKVPKGNFYIKSTTSTSVSSTQNLVLDVEHGFFATWGVIKDWAKIIIAQQRNKTNNIEQDSYQLWRYEDGFLINKQTFLCLEPESIKAGSRLILRLRRFRSQAANQMWILTNEGHIKLRDKPFLLEVKDKNIVLTDIRSKSFNNTLASQFIIMPLHPVRKCVAIGVVRLELICAGLVFRGCSGHYDPYVRVFHFGNNTNIIAKTKVINNDFNPVWNEVHYLPVNYDDEKFILEVMDSSIIKDKPLGNCHLEITNELVKEVSEGIYEGTPDGIDVWRSLSYGETFRRSIFYILITLQTPNGGFPPSVKLANIFGYDSQEHLLKLYKSQCCEERILKFNHTVWTTSMILWFLRFLLNECKSEWGYIYERAEQFISKEIADLEIEETVVATGRKAKRIMRITRETISITHVRRILKCQKNTGAYSLTDDIAKSFGYEDTKKLQTTFNTYKNTHSKSQKIISQIWSTIMVLYFYRYVAIDQKNEWYPTYERSYRWLWAQLMDNESDKQEYFKINIQEIDQKPYGIARIEIINAKNLTQADSWFADGAYNPYIKISTFSTSWIFDDTHVIYNNCNPVWRQVFYIPVYDIYESFNLQVFNYNALLKDTLLGFYIFDLKSIIKKLPNGSYEVKKLKLDVNLTYVESNREQLSFVADFFLLSELEDLEIITTTNVSIRHLYLLMTYQNQNGYFELNNTLARSFNFFSKEELIKTFSDFVQKDERACSFDNNIWNTLLVTSFLKVLLWKERCEWMSAYNRAENWLSKNITDPKIEKQLFNYSNKFVIQHFKVTQWIDENQQRSIGVLETISSLFHILWRILNLKAQCYILKQYKKVELHENILKFIGILNQSIDEVEYFCEYAYDGTLRQYLKQNFYTINWKDRLYVANQIVSALKLLHENDIIHMNLNSESIFVHKGNIKINIFKCQNNKLKFPQYVDPYFLQNSKIYNLNRSSDIYNAIIQGKRESAAFGTPKEYVTIYTKCWQHEQSLRPTVQDVYKALTSIIYDSTYKKIEVECDINHKLDTLSHYVNQHNEATKELKKISSIIATLKKNDDHINFKTLKEITK
ncbi:kinase-like protein [Gigaspora margarita]|uniref:Kinase-like protein n=1 Tax=Gigaspora margarita TaxID=4874 RepID=A0A8H3XJL7_GIGMA|nr:kinase-like protein [Gigaspora margarita]